MFKVVCCRILCLLHMRLCVGKLYLIFRYLIFRYLIFRYLVFRYLVFIPPSKKKGYIGVTVTVCLSVGSHILSGLFHWVEFNKSLHEGSIPRGDVHILGVTIACYFTEIWPFYLLSKPYFVRPVSYKPLGGIQKNSHEASIPRGDVHILKGLQLHVILQSYGPFTY